ncbi:MAG: acyl-CoA desaturase [Polyangiales bacterium]
MQRDIALSAAQIESFGEEMYAIHQRARAARGAQDVAYIRRVIRWQQGSEIAGRALLFASFVPGAWVAGTALLSLSKILENMEVGHNVMHGQYDFTGDPALSSRGYEWDNACPSELWRHSHNYLHHTFTNVRGVDHDLGYRVLRVDESQPWAWHRVPQVVYAGVLAALFQWGVAAHDVDVLRYLSTPRAARDPEDVKRVREIKAKGWRQVRKDYLLFPLLAGPNAPWVFAGNLVANVARNLWAAAVIYCGHFPEQAQTFAAESLEAESRGQFYLRQLLGSANFDGPRWLHVLSGHLSHQIEHHLFPDVPSWRYPALSKEVRALCEKYGLPYNTGTLSGQLASALRRILRLSLPPRTELAPATAA